MEIKQLKKLGNREFLGDIKKYITNTHGFYKDKVPEMQVMAQRLHDEYSLKDFYKVFYKLWHAGNGERSLAIHTLELYHEEFDEKTWEFLPLFLREVKSFDELECFGEIISYLYVKHISIKRALFRLAHNENLWMRRIPLVAVYSAMKRKEEKDIIFMIKIVEQTLFDREEKIQTMIIALMKEIGKTKRELLKKFILKHMSMPDEIFLPATEKMKELRKMRKLKKFK
jgi:hypothetical protein